MTDDADEPAEEPTIASLHDRLEATRERPVERGAARWIAEAEAVTADLVGDDVSNEVLADRLGHVESLLANVDDAEDEAANRHVAAAKRLTNELLDELGDARPAEDRSRAD